MTDCVEILVIGSGFGGAVVARRLVEGGRHVMMLERGPWRRTAPNVSAGIKDTAPLPQGYNVFTHGIRSIRSYFMKDDVVFNKKGFAELYCGKGINIIATSNVGGGSHVYAGLLGRPGNPAYWEGHNPDISQNSMEKYYDEIVSQFGARPVLPEDEIPNTIEQTNYDGKLAPLDVGQIPLAILLPKTPGTISKVVTEDGVERSECDMKNNSFLGSPSGAKTTLDFSFIWPAMRHGLSVRDMCEVASIHKLNGHGTMRYEVRYRNHKTGLDENVFARHVILAAGGLNTVRLLLHSRDNEHGLTGMPSLGRRFSGNGDFFGFWKEDSQKDLTRGLPITMPFRVRESLNKTVLVLRSGFQGLDKLVLPSFVKKWLRRQSVIIAFGGDTNNGIMSIKKGKYKVEYDQNTNDIYQEIKSELESIQNITKTTVYAPSAPVTVHPNGGACLGRSHEDGVVGANGEVFDNLGLYVADAAALPVSPGGPPTLTTAVWAANVADRLLNELQSHPAKYE